MRDSKAAFDYRKSHLGRDKGESYSKSFLDNPNKRLVWSYEQIILDRVVQQYLLPSEIRHLDFACGTGRILEYLSKFEAISSVGIDISQSMLEVARSTSAHTEFIEGDLTRSDLLGDRKFNLITAFRFFPNAQYELRRSAISALAGCLDSNGILIFNNHKNLSFPINRMKRLVGRGFNRGMTMMDAKRLVETAGLIIADIYHFGIIPSTNNHILLPAGMLKRLELFLSGRESLRNYALNQIFVCRCPK